jgi:hypothetical protein
VSGKRTPAVRKKSNEAGVCDHARTTQRARSRQTMLTARLRSGKRRPLSIFHAYVTGVMTRGCALQALKLEWYGDLCILLARQRACLRAGCQRTAS